ncbi:MAG TPA: hypothetical protein VMG12_30695 [Polyangiaceae bacterium]|nr:hypothetical protein [Polyangiaceae bacterium]
MAASCRFSFTCGVLLAGGGLACSGMLSEPAPQVETAALHDAQGDAVIATLHTKDSELRVLSSGGRVRYSLLDAEGVSKSLTLDELQSYDKNLYEFVKAAMAHGVAGKGGAVPPGAALDARVVPQPDEAERDAVDPIDFSRRSPSLAPRLPQR